MCDFYQHPSAPPVVLTDPRHQAVLEVEPQSDASVRRSIEARDAERALIGYVPPTAEDLELLDVKDGLFALIRKYGGQRVMRWVRNLAHAAGDDLPDDRPSHLCLADGAALKNKICVQCGRDNS